MNFLINFLYAVSLADAWAETHSYDGDLERFPFCLVSKWGQKQAFYRQLYSGVNKGV